MRKRAWLALLGLVAACNVSTGPTGEAFRDLPADIVMTGMQSYMTSGGIRKARLQGDTAFVFDDSTSIKVKGVTLVFFDEQGTESGSLTSLAGDFNNHTQAMVARGNVVMVTKVGNRRIETEELHYDPTSHRLWSTVKTLIVEGGSRFTGSDFEADDRFQNVRMTNMSGHVQGKMKF